MTPSRPGVLATAAATVVACGVIATLLLSGGVHSQQGPAPAPALGPDRRPCLTTTAIEQSPTGRIDGCIAVGPLHAGRYDVSLEQVLWWKQVPTSQRSLTSATVTLSPSSGPPGSVVTLRAILPATVPAHTRRQLTSLGRTVLGMIEWDGPGGLSLSARHFRWISPRAFTAEVTVPPAPWIQRGAQPRILGLRSGTFPIVVTCARGRGGCTDLPAGVANFRLHVTRRTRWCERASSCATLTVYPRRVPDGALVRISGYLPLAVWDDGGTTAAFFGNVHIGPGRGDGAPLRIGSGGSDQVEHAGHAALDVLGGPALASLGTITPRRVVFTGQQQIAADPADPQIVAWCAGGAIDVSVNGRVNHISTAPVTAVLRGLGGLASDGEALPLSCADVMPLSATTMLAAFPGGLAQFNDAIPPVYLYAAETRDGGKHWTALPVPPGSRPADFGGFRSDGRAVEAIYARAGRSATAPVGADHPLVERAATGGGSWRSVHPGCLDRRSCVTLGPFLPGNCAQGLSTQFVLRSSDRGRSWRRARILDPYAFACGDGQLAAIGGREALLVNALSPYPLQLSRDAGASWIDLTMPSPARLQAPVNELNDFGPGGITLLPDGSLLLSGGGAYRGGWQLLKPRAHHWCDVAGQHGTWQFTPQASRLTLIGSELWWLTYANTPAHGPTPTHLHRLPLAAVRCT